jgi:HEAT repeat protein/beta-lactamase regulating signal transducer with metallopeptidase domain
LLAKLLLGALPARMSSLRYSIAVGALALMPATVVVTAVRGVGEPAPLEIAPADEPVARAAESLAPSADVPSSMAETRSTRATIEHASKNVPAVRLSRSWRQRVEGALPWVVGAWAAGALVLSLRLLSGYSATRRLVRARREPAPETVLALIERLKSRLGVRRAVRVWCTGMTQVPAVVGSFAPILLLPASALTGLSTSELEAILAHELAHVRRHDYLVNVLQSLIETLLFYHPAVWWLGARIRAEREHCCDDLAVAACGSAPLYAGALLSMERLRAAPELAMALTGGSLLSRVERLLAPRARGLETLPRWMAGMSAAAIVLAFVGTSDLAGAASQQRERSRREQDKQERNLPTRAGEVVQHPDPSQPLSRRNEWARDEASRRGYREYWVGHAIAPSPAFGEGLLMGHFNGGLVIGDGDSQITINGGVITSSDFGSLRLPGEPLAPLVGADPGDLGVLYLCSDRSVRRVHLATAALAVDFEGLPLLWLGKADDRESVPDALARMEQVKTDELRRDLIGVVGAHSTSALVVPELTRLLASATLGEELRVQAAEWLGYHPDMDALRALDAAARRDRSSEVRREAAEAVGEMKFAPAFDVLVALAHELKDSDARREAVEGLGERSEPGAVAALEDIANHDRNGDIQREAVEALGEVPDGAGLSALSAIAHHHPNQDVRSEAIETYGECASVDDALAFLQHMIERDSAPDVRREAVETLGEIHDERVVDILVGIIDGREDPDVQREAVETLAETVSSEAVMPVLERVALHHPLVDVRREACETLGEIHDDRVVDALTRIVEGADDPEVQREAVETLGETVAGSAVLPVLERIALHHAQTDVRREACETLGEIHDMRVVDILTRIVDGADDIEVQREAVETLGETIAGAETAPVLERIARSHTELDIQREAVETLGELCDDENGVLDVVEGLATNHPSEEIRIEAVETLAEQLPENRAAAVLNRLLAAERSRRVREALKDALDEL